MTIPHPCPQVSEPVPEGVNIFNIMNLSAPENVSLLENWVVFVNPNTTQYAQIKGQFEVRRRLRGFAANYRVTQLVVEILFVGSHSAIRSSG